MSSNELFDIDPDVATSPLPKRRTAKSPLVGQDAINIDKWRKRIEAEARPGETYQQAAERLKREEAKKPKDTAPGREAVKASAGRKQVVVLE
ncbi:TPA: RNA replicase, partial [Pseudomonas aeruginosa]|nr:RNA replicase [Pseudomonas aeruginosa]